MLRVLSNLLLVVPLNSFCPEIIQKGSSIERNSKDWVNELISGGSGTEFCAYVYFSSDFES